MGVADYMLRKAANSKQIGYMTCLLVDNKRGSCIHII